MNVETDDLTALLSHEEERLAKINEKEEKRLKAKFEKEQNRLKDEALSKEREKEIKGRRYKRLMHLLKDSQMFSSLLKNKMRQADDGKNSKKRKQNPNEQQIKQPKRMKLNDNYNVVEVLDEINTQEKTEEGESEPLSQDNTDENQKKNYFENTRVTSEGITVSSYQPQLLTGAALRDYQLEGMDWLKLLFQNGVNGILADEMGLGKTIQVISFICFLLENGVTGPFLIVAPLSTIPNWMAEFHRFAPQVPTFLFHGKGPERAVLVKQLKARKNIEALGKETHQVIITSFEVPIMEKNALGRIQWHYVIVDEGQRIKKHTSRLAVVLRRFDAVGRLILTGTPIQNNLYELWSLLNFLLPEIFDNVDVFESWFDVDELQAANMFIEEKLNVDVITSLHQILQPFLLRREKKDVLLNLPPKKEIVTYCPMVPLQMELYKAVLNRSIEQYINPASSNQPTILDPSVKRLCRTENRPSLPPPSPREYIFNFKMQHPTMQLQKIVDHPYLVQFPFLPGTKTPKIDEEMIKSSGKLLVLDVMLKKLKSRGHKVLIFTSFTSMLDILEEHALMRGYNYCRLDGNVVSEVRQRDIDVFNNDSDAFVFYISIRAGGLGINLASADTVILYDSDWNPQVNLQAQDRCHRIGQTRPVVVYKFCTAGTIDERIASRGNSKRRLEKLIIRNGKFKANSVAKTTLDDLYELKSLIDSVDDKFVIHSNGFDEELNSLLDRSNMMETSGEVPVGDDSLSDKENVPCASTACYVDMAKNNKLSSQHLTL